MAKDKKKYLNKNLRVHIAILAAGKGLRMKSEIPKAFTKIAHRESCGLIFDKASNLKLAVNSRSITNEFNRNIIVDKIFILLHDSFQNMDICKSLIEEMMEKDGTIIFTDRQKGTADAVQTCIKYGTEKDIISNEDAILVLYGDSPLILTETLEKMLDNYDKNEKDDIGAIYLGFIANNSNGYGRIIADVETDKDRYDDIESRDLIKIKSIVEDKDASTEEKKIQLCNGGSMIAKVSYLESFFLSHYASPHSSNEREFYLTDLPIFLASQGKNSECMIVNEIEILGFNNCAELARVEGIMQDQLRTSAMKHAKMASPESVHFAFDTTVDEGSIIEPFVVFGAGVRLGKNTVVHSFCYLENVDIRDRSKIGPFARIRGKSLIDEDAKIGNFVEIKNSFIGCGTKAGHLAYIGDATLGRNVNIGAGAIFCNYDGKKKHSTIVGDNAFIGSLSAIIAPRKIGQGAVIGACSPITLDVSNGQMAIARTKQQNIDIKIQDSRNARDNGDKIGE